MPEAETSSLADQMQHDDGESDLEPSSQIATSEPASDLATVETPASSEAAIPAAEVPAIEPETEADIEKTSKIQLPINCTRL